MERVKIEKAYYKNGKIKSECCFKNGIPHGKHKHWHENGVLAWQWSFKEGIPDGIGNQWDLNGNLIVSYEIVDGSGVQKMWVEAQQFFVENTWHKGRMTGRTRTYLKDGTVISEGYQFKGKMISKEQYFDECRKDPTMPRYDNNENMSKNEVVPSKEPRTSPIDSSSDKFCNDIISSSKAVEAREWLKDRKCYLGEDMDEKETAALIESFYKAGAVNIWIFDITEDEPGVEYSGRMIIELPKDDKSRRKLVKLSNKVTAGDGFEEEIDYSQKYIFLMLD